MRNGVAPRSYHLHGFCGPPMHWGLSGLCWRHGGVVGELQEPPSPLPWHPTPSTHTPRGPLRPLGVSRGYFVAWGGDGGGGGGGRGFCRACGGGSGPAVAVTSLTGCSCSIIATHTCTHSRDDLVLSGSAVSVCYVGLGRDCRARVFAAARAATRVEASRNQVENERPYGWLHCNA